METLWEVTLGARAVLRESVSQSSSPKGRDPKACLEPLGFSFPLPFHTQPCLTFQRKVPPHTHTHSEACSARFPWEIKVVSGEEKPKAVLNMAFYWGPFYKNVSPRQVVSDLLLSLRSKEDLIILSANRPLKYFFEARQLSEIKRAERYGQKKPPFISICFFREQCFLGALCP